MHWHASDIDLPEREAWGLKIEDQNKQNAFRLSGFATHFRTNSERENHPEFVNVNAERYFGRTSV